jgi:hypothetical protein
MTMSRTLMGALLSTLLLTAGFSGRALAADPKPDTQPQPQQVVTDDEIQARMDRAAGTEQSDRQAVRDLLSRPEVRKIAGDAGLDIARADAAAGVLSGPELERVAAQARDVNTQLSGGAMTLSWPLLIVIVVLLVVIIASL